MELTRTYITIVFELVFELHDYLIWYSNLIFIYNLNITEP
jgi:hypothetical protein